MSRNGKAKRNAAIRAAYAAGETMQSIADRYGISRQRVDQIIHWRRHRARAAFQDAVKRGEIHRADECERCGAPDPHGHHPDYSEPLTVEWLCSSCHAEEHAGPRVERVEIECGHCGESFEVTPSRAEQLFCSRQCAARGADRPGPDTALRIRRVEAAAATLRAYVATEREIPGTLAFAIHATGRPKGAAIPTLCQRVDPNQRHFGSYAATLDAVYEAAGFQRPTYGSDPLPDSQEAA